MFVKCMAYELGCVKKVIEFKYSTQKYYYIHVYSACNYQHPVF